MKNLAIIVQNLHNGGAERMAANMSKELAKYLNVYLIVFDSDEAIYSYGGKLIDLKVPPVTEGSIFKRVMNTLKRVRRLKYIKRKHEIDCTISHMGGANLVNILSRHRDKVISVYHSMPSKEFSISIKNKLVQRFIAKHSDKYVVVSKPAMKDMIENFGVPAAKMKCIYNFSDIDDIRRLGEEKMPETAVAFFEAHDKVFVHAGRLTKLKAQDRLLRVLSELRKSGMNAGLIILGDGEEKEALIASANEEGLKEHVLFTGEVKNPFSYIKHSDLFVLCSRYEGLPMVLIEALCLKCPVVSLDMRSGAREILAPDTDIEKVADTVEYAKYGVLTPPYEDKDASAEACLVKAVREMLENIELRSRYLAGCDEAAENFAPGNIIPQWLEL